MTVYKSAIGKYASKIGIGTLALSLPVLAGCVTIDRDAGIISIGRDNTVNTVYDQEGRKVARSSGRRAGGMSYINPKTGESVHIDTPTVFEASGGYGWGGYGYWGYPYCGSSSLILNEEHSRASPYDRNQFPATHD